MQDPYPATFQRRHHNISLGAVFFSLHVNNNLSKKLNGRNVNWFPNGKSLATIIAESVEVSIYGIKPSSVPTESIPGGFGYGTLFVVGGRGDEGYGYGYAIYNGSNATGSRIFATYDKESGWNDRVSKSDLEPVKSRQINTYTSANKDTDATLSSYESKTENFILLFTSNDTTGTIPTLTGSHLFVIEHLLVGDDSASAIERAYSTKGKLIAWRFKQWWNKTWTAWENS